MSILDKRAELPHPIDRNFDQSQWRELLSSTACSDDDRNIAKIALIVGQHLQRVRERSDATLSKLPPSVDQRIGLYTGVVNLATLGIMRRGRVDLRASAPTTEMILHQRLSGISAGGYISADEGVSGIIDASKYPVAYLAKAPSISPGAEDYTAALMEHFYCGQIYSAWAGLWEEVLFRGLRLDGDTFYYPNPTLVTDPLIAEHRARKKAVGLVLAADYFWNALDSKSKKEFAKVAAMNDSDGYIRLKKLGYPKLPPFSFVMKLYAAGEVSPAIFDVPLPKFGGVSVNIILKCWACIGAAIRSRVDNFLERGGEPSEAESPPEDIETFYTFKRLTLVEDLSRLTGLSKGNIAEAVRALTFEPGRSRALWGSPLVKGEEDNLHALLAPFCVGAYLYPMRQWFKESSANIAIKGRDFETKIYNDCASIIAANPLLVGWSAHGNVRLRCGSTKEEVDLIIVTRSQIVIFEVKCLMPGYEPAEVHQYFLAVNGAIDQARRKMEAITAHYHCLEKILPAAELLNQRNVRCAVLLYHPLGCGFGASDCPVIDQGLLRPFLSNEGEEVMEFSNGGLSTIGDTPRYYSSGEEADVLFLEHLGNPLELDAYKRRLAERQIKLPASDGAISGYSMSYFDIDPDEDVDRVLREAAMLPRKGGAAS